MHVPPVTVRCKRSEADGLLTDRPVELEKLVWWLLSRVEDRLDQANCSFAAKKKILKSASLPERIAFCSEVLHALFPALLGPSNAEPARRSKGEPKPQRRKSPHSRSAQN